MNTNLYQRYYIDLDNKFKCNKDTAKHDKTYGSAEVKSPLRFDSQRLIIFSSG